MKDIRNVLLTALVPALKTATGRNVYTRAPKAANVVYPYIYVGDIYMTENGPKTSDVFDYDVLIQVIYQDIDDLGVLFTDMDNVLSIVNHSTPFALTGGYKIRKVELLSSSDTEFQTETGTQNVGLIRLLFNIE